METSFEPKNLDLETIANIRDGIDRLIFLALGNRDFDCVTEDDRAKICITLSFSQDLGQAISSFANEERKTKPVLKIE